MASRPEIIIRFYKRDDLTLLGSITQPRKITIKSGFGAQKRRCWLEFYNDDLDAPADLGTVIEIWINETSCFRGRILQRRIDCVDDYLSVFAEWDPDREFQIVARKVFVNQTIPTMLDSVLSGSGLTRTGSFDCDTVFSRLEFFKAPLFAAIDLLAKLAGNCLWDVRENSSLSFRLPSTNPDHELILDKNTDTLNLWETNEDLHSEIEVQGGINGGSTYDNWIVIPEIAGISEIGSIRVYARPISSYDSFSNLQRAIIDQMTRPHYEHHIDLAGTGETIAPGETVQLSIDNYSLLPDNLIFRVKMRELVYSHETVNTKLHLTSGLESSPSYFHYHRKERVDPPSFLQGKIGPFQLDLSALDSVSHIDET